LPGNGVEDLSGIRRMLSRLPAPVLVAVNPMLREDRGLVSRLLTDMHDVRFPLVDPDDGVRHGLILSIGEALDG